MISIGNKIVKVVFKTRMNVFKGVQIFKKVRISYEARSYNLVMLVGSVFECCNQVRNEAVRQL